MKVNSLGKALTILECVTAQEPGLGVTRLAERLDRIKSNVYNILDTFRQGGYVEKLPNGKYTLGLELLEFSCIIHQHLGYPRAVYDLLTDLANRTNEIVSLGLPHGSEALYLYVAYPTKRVREPPYWDILGERAPLYYTGAGKAILAAMPQTDWDAHIATPPTPSWTGRRSWRGCGRRAAGATPLTMSGGKKKRPLCGRAGVQFHRAADGRRQHLRPRRAS